MRQQKVVCRRRNTVSIQTLTFSKVEMVVNLILINCVENKTITTNRYDLVCIKKMVIICCDDCFSSRFMIYVNRFSMFNLQFNPNEIHTLCHLLFLADFPLSNYFSTL